MTETVVINFGRFQGPHRGHEMLADFMKQLAAKHNGDYLIYPSLTVNDKNPLTPGIKKLLLENLLPSHKDHLVLEHENNIVSILKQLQATYKRVIFVCGSDRVDSFRNFLPRYNGSEYNFDSIQITSVGDARSDCSAGIAACSASKMREYVRTNNYKDFLVCAPRSASRWDVKAAFEVMKLYVIKV